MNKNNNSIINSPAPPSIQQTGQSNVNVTNLPGGNVNLIQNSPVEYDENGVPYTPVNHVRFDSQNSIIYLGNEQVSIPVELVQPGLLNPEELPYVNALCDVYAEKLGKAAGDITPDMIPTLFKNFTTSLFLTKESLLSSGICKTRCKRNICRWRFTVYSIKRRCLRRHRRYIL